MKTTSKIFILLLPLTFIFLSSFDLPVPPLKVVSIEKTTCRMIRPGKFKQEVHLNLDTPNLTHFNGQTAYYFFYDNAGNLMETASAVVGPNPQVVTVTKLTGGITYGIKPNTNSGQPFEPDMDVTFTANFPCKMKAPAPASVPKLVIKKKNN